MSYVLIYQKMASFGMDMVVQPVILAIWEAEMGGSNAGPVQGKSL
jgi:hypothetical protein